MNEEEKENEWTNTNTNNNNNIIDKKGLQTMLENANYMIGIFTLKYGDSDVRIIGTKPNYANNNQNKNNNQNNQIINKEVENNNLNNQNNNNDNGLDNIIITNPIQRVTHIYLKESNGKYRDIKNDLSKKMVIKLLKGNHRVYYIFGEKVQNMSYMFAGCKGLIELDVSNFDAKNVTDMSSMFYECSRLESIKIGGKFDTKNKYSRCK